jgi:hypothetical protein
VPRVYDHHLLLPFFLLSQELDLSAAVVQALTEASKDLGPCWQGSGPPPPELKSPFGTPLDFFAALRHPTQDPAPEVWECVRSKYSKLAELTDDDLVIALQPIKDVAVDRRYLK